MNIKDLNKKLDEFFSINETKPGRAWEGKLNKIDELLSWMYDKGILTQTEKKKKDSLFHKYYRYYNDGDFPRGLKNTSAKDYETAKYYRKYDPSKAKETEEQIELELEEQLEAFIKKILTKYLPKINRKEFHRDSVMSGYDLVLDILKRHDVNGIRHWLNAIPDDTSSLDLDKLFDLYKQYNEQVKDIPADSWGTLGGKTFISGKKKAMETKPELEPLIKEIESTMDDMYDQVLLMKQAAEKFWAIEE